MPILREVSSDKAIGHALWEAHACIGQWAFCACLTMLRKALDIWSADYRDRSGMSFDKTKGERDILYWRLKKIAESNALYRDSIHQIIDGIRLDANDAVHNCFMCVAGFVGTRDGSTIAALREPVEKLHQLVVNLIVTTRRDIEVGYSDESRWKPTPPDMMESEVSAGQSPNIPFKEIEKELPELFAEMREDLRKYRHVREFILKSKKTTYIHDPNHRIFEYYFETHSDLRGKIGMLENYNLVRDIAFNDVPRFVFSEELVKYLLDK
jgi:hypothetical protein